MKGKIWVDQAQDCIKKYKGKMVRFHLKQGGKIEGILSSHWKNKYLIAACINKNIVMVAISYHQIHFVEILYGLSLDGKKHVCSFIYTSQN